MIIEKNRAVSINYVLTNDAGETLDSTQYQTPMVYLHGANNILPVLENALEGKTLKSRVRTKVTPGDGYGEYNEELVQSVPLSSFPNADKIKAGTQFQLDTSQGPKIATITKVENGEFTLDMNHPLAGQTLNFDIEVVDIREASAEEIEKGHVHTEGCGCGHSHGEDCGCGQSHGEDCGCDHDHKGGKGCNHSH
ncbi:MAG: peptidylprolyl isomerase [Proteobacteria bacterium]|nr:peptidylprolyl isomerase [Pseudomonadota bacterium]